MALIDRQVVVSDIAYCDAEVYFVGIANQWVNQILPQHILAQIKSRARRYGGDSDDFSSGPDTDGEGPGLDGPDLAQVKARAKQSGGEAVETGDADASADSGSEASDDDGVDSSDDDEGAPSGTASGGEPSGGAASGGEAGGPPSGGASGGASGGWWSM